MSYLAAYQPVQNPEEAPRLGIDENVPRDTVMTRPTRDLARARLVSADTSSSTTTSADPASPSNPNQGQDAQATTVEREVQAPSREVRSSRRVEPLATPRSRFRVLRKWEGTVERVDSEAGEISVVVSDLLDHDAPEEYMTMSLDELPPGDLDLVAPGAVFYWSIGYEDLPDGQRKRSSSLRFRRLPLWTDRELASARARAEALQGELEW